MVAYDSLGAPGQSIHDLLKAYVKARPEDDTVTALNTIDVKTMTELW